MDLAVFADRYIGTDGGVILAEPGPASRQLLQAVRQDKSRVQPLIGSLCWQAFTQLPHYPRMLESAGLDPYGGPRDRQEIIVQRSTGTALGSRYDMVVLDSGYRGAEPATLTVDVSPEQLADVVGGLFNRSRLPQVFESGGLDLVRGVVMEAARAQPFHVLVASPPATIATSFTAAPGWLVGGISSGFQSSASAGVVATDAAGRVGATSADHAFKPDASHAFVNGYTGKIVSRHALSDSCFIELDGVVRQEGRPVTGPLTGFTPREGETVTFAGSTQHGSTIVTGWDKGIPFEIHPWNRLRVLTRAVTNPGDSGAALLSGTGDVVGFAFDRTGYDAEIEYSAWIWAEFVFMAHGLH